MHATTPWILGAALGAAIAGCATVPSKDGVAGAGAAGRSLAAMQRPHATHRAVELQSAVMAMADEWNAALGQACTEVEASAGPDLRQRALAQAMLRNGFGASLDIAAGPNPAVAMVDMLVLSSLQPWALATTWAGHGLEREAAQRAAVRLRATRDELWSRAAAHLSTDDLARLRSLVDAWIERHPGQQLVSFVRLSDFAADRNQLTLADREAAGGFLRELEDVTSAVDDARLLGERALWYAARYPYVVGQQAEFSAYRAADALSQEFRAQREELFRQVAAERQAIVTALDEESRALQPTLAEARATIKEAQALSAELLRIVTAVDALVARFDNDGSEGGLTVEDLDRLLVHGGETASEARKLIESGGALVSSDRWPAAAAAADGYLVGLVDRALLGGAGLIALLVAGLA
ncbi:MAG: hypothetical protein ACKOV8_05950, partial [Phycisphaerales bacterium]